MQRSPVVGIQAIIALVLSFVVPTVGALWVVSSKFEQLNASIIEVKTEHAEFKETIKEGLVKIDASINALSEKVSDLRIDNKTSEQRLRAVEKKVEALENRSFADAKK